MRILTVVHELPWDGFGGVHNYVLESCRHLRERGHEIVLLGGRVTPNLPACEEIDGFRVWRHPMANGAGSLLSPFVSGRRFGHLYEQLAGGAGFDVINVHSTEADYPLSGTAAYAQTPSVATFHASWLDEIPFEAARHPYPWLHWKRYAKAAWIRLLLAQRRHTERRMLERVDRVLVLSEFMKSRVRSLHGVAEEKITVVPSGVDTRRFRPCDDRAELRRRLGEPAEGALLFTARRLVTRTGVEELVEAMATVVRQRPDARLVIAGAGYLRAALAERIERLGLGARVRLLGFVKDEELVGFHQAANLFVLPTVALEGFGIATIEALACGVPVIGTNVGATPEILEPIDPALIVEASTSRALSEGILSWLRRPEELAALRPRCRAAAMAYSWQGIAARLESAFEMARGAGRP